MYSDTEDGLSTDTSVWAPALGTKYGSGRDVHRGDHSYNTDPGNLLTVSVQNPGVYDCGKTSHTAVSSVEAEDTKRADCWKQSPLSDATWVQYEERFSHVDTKFVKTWDKDLDTLLLFAALFSAVLTAFVIESYQYMTPASNKTEVILQQILVALQSNGSLPANTHILDVEPDASAVPTFVRINVLWFASLVTSVSTAFLAMLSKEWLADLHEGRDDTSAEMHMRGRQIQLRYDSMREWRLSLVLPFLPFLMHVSLLLFFAGLVDFLWYFNKTVGIVAAIFVSGMVLIYIWTHIRSIFSATCPYKTSLTFLILIFVNSVRKRLSLDLPAALARVWVFMAVTYEEYWTYKDPELFRAIWDVLVVSWFGRAWRRLLTTLGDTHILPKNLWNLWARHIGLGPTNIVRLREEAYISGHPELMDARVLARMIGAYPNIGDSAQLARELCDFPALVRYRALFIDAGAIDLLVHHIFDAYRHSHLYPDDLGAKDRDMVLHQYKALARLLTEAETNDARTVIFKIQGIPVLWDFRLRRVPSYIRFWYHPEKTLTDSRLCRTDAPVDYDLDDIVLYSHMLRLQLIVSSNDWYSKEVQSSVLAFFDQLLKPDTVRDLDDDALTALANATIFVGMRPIRVERAAVKGKKTEADVESGTAVDPDDQERKLQAAHASNALTVLAALLKNRPDMGLPVLRQIGWGIWMLSRPIPRSLSGLLVPTITSFDTLAPALARLLSHQWDRNTLIDSILVLMTCFLPSRFDQQRQLGYSTDSNSEDCRQLMQALLERYPQFLRRMRMSLNPTIVAKLSNLLNIDLQDLPAFWETTDTVESSALLNTLRHVVDISGIIWDSSAGLMPEADLPPAIESSSDPTDSEPANLISEDDRTSILSATLDMLCDVCSHLERIKATRAQDMQAIYILVLRFVCRAATVHFQTWDRRPDLAPIDEKDIYGADVSVAAPGLGDGKESGFPAVQKSWSFGLGNGSESAHDLAVEIEQALRAAKAVIKEAKDVVNNPLGLKIITTLLVTIVVLQCKPENTDDPECERLKSDMLDHLRREDAEGTIGSLALILDGEDRELVDKALEVVRDPSRAEPAEVGRRSSSDGRDDDKGIFRRVGSDLRSLVQKRKALSRTASEGVRRTSQIVDTIGALKRIPTTETHSPEIVTVVVDTGGDGGSSTPQPE
ncbi:hypothetical protein EVJ58_g3523 [Rhodofomes roseus]|uniref:DUF6535 domain-containing protein n=1 Tax=Rhodofomes roseus TaxID=34475 RepID=A0A4Y9YN92_9APHY|nr:hypothetical protein EVJ58_g3523 [Rhodofomes roseus]